MECGRNPPRTKMLRPEAMASMVLLTLFSSAGAIVLRLSRTSGGPQYLASTCVVMTELLKLVISLLFVASTTSSGRAAEDRVTGSKQTNARPTDIAAKCRYLLAESLPMAVPSILYVVQQMMLIVAASLLDAVLFTICSQLRILTTAFFAVTLLHKQLSPLQWLSLPVLGGGIVLVTLNSSGDWGGRGAEQGEEAGGMGGGNASNESYGLRTGGVPLGMAACFLAALSSGYASVHFELHLKRPPAAPHPGSLRDGPGRSVWERNVQLSLYGLPLAVLVMMVKDAPRLGLLQLLQGFRLQTWCVVLLQAGGGLAIGLVVKHADNLLKQFAYAASVLLVVLLSIMLFGLQPSWALAGGVALVVLAMLMYAQIGMFSSTGQLAHHLQSAALPWTTKAKLS